MHAVVRRYSGHGAEELFDRLEERKDDVEKVLRGVSGFRSYTLLRTDEGGIAVTVCDDEAGTDESVRVAREWVAANASDITVAPPAVSGGPVILQLG